MAPADHYATLGVPRDADAATITRAFRKLARKSHPDLNKDKQADARFKAVAEAYGVLKHPDKRAAYDNPPPEAAPAHARAHPHASAHPRQRPPPPDDQDLADLLAAFTRGMHGDQASGAASPQAGRSHEHTVPLALRDAHRGTTLRVQVPGPDVGSGTRSLDVTIPPGTIHGQTLRLRGQGEPGRHGGPAGDIYLHMAVQPDPVFSVHGPDLHMDLTLAPWQAVLGDDVEVPTLDGPVLLTVPAGTRAGRKLRLRGRGLAHGAGVRGDLYALARIDVPAKVSAQAQALYRALAELASAPPVEADIKVGI